MILAFAEDSYRLRIYPIVIPAKYSYTCIQVTSVLLVLV